MHSLVIFLPSFIQAFYKYLLNDNQVLNSILGIGGVAVNPKDKIHTFKVIHIFNVI